MFLQSESQNSLKNFAAGRVKTALDELMKTTIGGLPMTQERLAEVLNVSDRSIRYYFAEERLPELEVLVRLAELTDRRVTWFFDDADPSAGRRAKERAEIESEIAKSALAQTGEAIVSLRADWVKMGETIRALESAVEQKPSNVTPIRSGRPTRESLGRIPERKEPTGEFNPVRAKAANTTKKPQRGKGEK